MGWGQDEERQEPTGGNKRNEKESEKGWGDQAETEEGETRDIMCFESTDWEPGGKQGQPNGRKGCHMERARGEHAKDKPSP